MRTILAFLLMFAVFAGLLVLTATTGLDGPGSSSVANTIRGYEMTMTSVSNPAATFPGNPGPGEARAEEHVWHLAPDKWRSETLISSLPGEGAVDFRLVAVGDGQTFWTYNSRTNSVEIRGLRLADGQLSPS